MTSSTSVSSTSHSRTVAFPQKSITNSDGDNLMRTEVEEEEKKSLGRDDVIADILNDYSDNIREAVHAEYHSKGNTNNGDVTAEDNDSPLAEGHDAAWDPNEWDPKNDSSSRNTTREYLPADHPVDMLYEALFED